MMPSPQRAGAFVGRGVDVGEGVGDGAGARAQDEGVTALIAFQRLSVSFLVFACVAGEDSAQYRSAPTLSSNATPPGPTGKSKGSGAATALGPLHTARITFGLRTTRVQGSAAVPAPLYR